MRFDIHWKTVSFSLLVKIGGLGSLWSSRNGFLTEFVESLSAYRPFSLLWCLLKLLSTQCKFRGVNNNYCTRDLNSVVWKFATSFDNISLNTCNDEVEDVSDMLWLSTLMEEHCQIRISHLGPYLFIAVIETNVFNTCDFLLWRDCHLPEGFSDSNLLGHVTYGFAIIVSFATSLNSYLL